MRPMWQLLQILNSDQNGILDCEECYQILEYLADLASDGADQHLIKESIVNYVRHCPHCDLHIQNKITAIEEKLAQTSVIPAGNQFPLR